MTSFGKNKLCSFKLEIASTRFSSKVRQAAQITRSSAIAARTFAQASLPRASLPTLGCLTKPSSSFQAHGDTFSLFTKFLQISTRHALSSNLWKTFSSGVQRHLHIALCYSFFCNWLLPIPANTSSWRTETSHMCHQLDLILPGTQYAVCVINQIEGRKQKV